jgi:hypothetical protein
LHFLCLAICQQTVREFETSDAGHIQTSHQSHQRIIIVQFEEFLANADKLPEYKSALFKLLTPKN